MTLEFIIIVKKCCKIFADEDLQISCYRIMKIVKDVLMFFSKYIILVQMVAMLWYDLYFIDKTIITVILLFSLKQLLNIIGFI
jgi:hypothetical protein